LHLAGQFLSEGLKLNIDDDDDDNNNNNNNNNSIHLYNNNRSRGSSGSIVSDYGLDDRAMEVRSPTGAEDFSSSPCVQTGSGAHPALLSNGYRGFFPWG
jgi:hypothetical protein